MSIIMGTPPQKFKKQMPQIAPLKGVHDSSGVFLILFGDSIAKYLCTWLQYLGFLLLCGMSRNISVV